MPIHVIGSSARSIFDIASSCTFAATLRVEGAAPAGELANARIACPRKGAVNGSDCLACDHLQAFRITPEVRLYCGASDSDPVTDWMRRKPPATTLETRCHAADQFAAARKVHHLLVFDRRLALAGIACRCDLGRGGAQAVASVMSTEIFAVEPSTSIGAAATAMKALRIGCLPVISDSLVLGILTRRDLERAGVPADALR